MNDLDNLVPRACRIIAARIGHVAPKVRDERIIEGLKGVMQALNASSLESALDELEALSIECPAWQRLIQAIAIGETNFMRHREWFAEIKRTILAPLIEERRRRGPKQIRLWSAGCSTGEEPYTLAMMVDGLVGEQADFDVRIIATDINEAALARARSGVYGRWATRELSPEDIERHFSRAGPKHFQLSSRLREMVEFKILNLCTSAYPDEASEFARFDLVVCRNVLIYFEAKDQLATAARLVQSVAPGGWLAVSPAEATAAWFKPLHAVNRSSAIFFCSGGPDTQTRPSSKSEGGKPATTKQTPAGAGNRTPPPGRLPPPAAASARQGRSTVPLTAPRALPAQAAAAKPAPPADRPASETLGHASGLADRGAYLEARQVCETHLANAGPDFGAYLLLATVALEIGDLQAAFEAARCAAYLEPDSPAAHYLLGTIHHRMGAHDLASRKMAVVLNLLHQHSDDAHICDHFKVTAGELRESARAYLGDIVAA